MKVKDWSRYPNFSREEFCCRHTGKEAMEEKMVFVLQLMRDQLGFPFIISSGYRDPSHPIEAAKDEPGEHSLGVAVDVQVAGEHALELLDCALANGIRRVGINQKGPYDKRFIHLGMGDIINPSKYMDAVWSY